MLFKIRNKELRTSQEIKMKIVSIAFLSSFISFASFSQSLELSFQDIIEANWQYQSSEIETESTEKARVLDANQANELKKEGHKVAESDIEKIEIIKLKITQSAIGKIYYEAHQKEYTFKAEVVTKRKVRCVEILCLEELSSEDHTAKLENVIEEESTIKFYVKGPKGKFRKGFAVKKVNAEFLENAIEKVINWDNNISANEFYAVAGYYAVGLGEQNLLQKIQNKANAELDELRKLLEELQKELEKQQSIKRT